MRCSSHKLMIEKGRKDQRVCSMCNSNDTEDEFLFILRCPAYNDLRKKYLKQRYVIDHLFSNYSLTLVDYLN